MRPVDPHRGLDRRGRHPVRELILELDAEPAVDPGRVDRHPGVGRHPREGAEDRRPRVDQRHVEVETDRGGRHGCPPADRSGRRAGSAGSPAGSIRARGASRPTISRAAVSAKLATTYAVQLPVATCSSPTPSGPALASRYPAACENADSEAAVAASGLRAAVKKIASARAAFWPAPRISAHHTPEPSGAYTSPARPPAIAATVGTTRTCWARMRWAMTGTTSETARLPTPITASRSPAPAADSPRSRKIVGSQDSVA